MRASSALASGAKAFVAALLLLLVAPRADAFVISVGATCQLTREVSIDIKTGQGRAKVPLAPGAKLTVVAVTAVSSRIQSGDFEGMIDNAKLEDACSYATETCALKNAVKVNERIDGEGKAWRIKPGGKLEILARGSPWSTVRIGPVEGFIESAALQEQCPTADVDPLPSDDERTREDDEGLDDDDDRDDGSDDEVDDDGTRAQEATPLVLKRPMKGTRVLLLPFLLDGRRDDGLAVLYEDALTGALTKSRTDTTGPTGKRPNARSRALTTKQVLVDLVPAAREAGLSHLIIVELSREAVEKEPERRTVRFDDEDDGYTERADLLVVTVFDIKARKVTKRLQVTPSLAFKDPWAERTVKVLETVLPTLPAHAKNAASGK
jgi:hypothetical protein